MRIGEAHQNKYYQTYILKGYSNIVEGEKGDAHSSRRNTMYKGTEMPKGKLCWEKCFKI